MREIQRRKISIPSSSSSPTVSPPVTVAVPAVPTARPIVSPSNSGEEQVLSSNSSGTHACAQTGPAGQTCVEVMEENEKLKRENVQLNRQLSEMKTLCSNIFTLMSSYTGGGGGCGGRALETNFQAMDLFSEKRETEEENPRLFGVAIGAKRAREGSHVEATAAEDDSRLKLQLNGSNHVVKPEPLDCQGNGGGGGSSGGVDSRRHSQQTPWLIQSHRPNQRVCN